MADNNEKVQIHVDAKVTGEDQITSFAAKMKVLQAQAKSINESFKQIGRVQPPGRNPSSSVTSAAQGEAKAKRQTLIFGREEAKLFRSRMTSQARASADAMKNERQSFADYKSRIATKAKFQAGEVRTLRDRMTAESRIAAMRARAENDAVRALKAKLASQDRAARQKVNESTAAARTEARQNAEAIRSVRNRISVHGRMMRQRLAEEKVVQREQARSIAETARAEATRMREHASTIRSNARLESSEMRRVERERSSARRTFRSSSREAMSHGSDAYHRITRPPAVAAAVGAAATVGFGRKTLGAEADIDSAEVNSRIYAGLSKEAARELRDKWASPLAESLGVNTSKMITSFTDAVKLGIPTEGAKQFSELATKTSEAWGVPFENVTDILGTVNTLLTSNGEAFNYDKLKSTANTLQYLAAKQSTTPEKLMSFMQRGAGAAQVLGMSQEAGLAFGSASTSLGNQAGQSGRMFDYVASRLIEMPRLTKKKGDEGKQARDLIRSLGYSSAEDMDKNRRASPDKFLPEFMERFSKIQNPKKQEEAIRFFTGREWMGEFGRMVKGNSTYKEAAKLAEEAKGLDAIGEVWELHKTKLSFVFKQFKAGWLNILGEFGKVLSPLARQAGDYFLEWSRKLQSGGLQARFRAAIDGLIEGFGFKDLPDMLKGMFGVPGEGEGGTVEKWKATAKAFAEGIRDVFGTIKGIASTLSGGDPEVIARWTGRIIALSAALLVLGPVLGILGGIVSLVVALGRAATAIKSLVGLGGGAAATGATAGAGAGLMRGLGLILSRLFALTVVAEIGANRGVISTWLLDAAKSIFQAVEDGLKAAFSKESIQAAMKGIVSEFIPAPVERWLNNDGKLEEKNGLGKKTLEGLPKGVPAAPVDPNERGYIGKAWDWLSSSLVGSAAASELPPGLRGQVNTATATPKASVGNELVEALEDNTNAIRSNLDRQGIMGSLIHRASITTASDGVKASLSDSANGVKQAVLSGFTGSGGTVTGGLSPLEGSVPGTRLNGGGGLSRRGIIGGAGSYAGSGPGGGVVSPTFRGDQKAIAKTAFDFFRSKGLSAEAASGILANMDAESSFNPRARGDGGKAHGMFQHHPDRRAAILRGTGIDMSTASPEKQLEGTWWEMNHGDAGAQRARKILQTPGISARDAGAAFVKHFERPAKDERAIRGSMAEGFVRQFGSGGGDAVPSSANDNATSSQVLQTARNLSVANQQCVSLAKAAVGASGSVMNWQRGVSAEAGTLKPGTPVATFMDALGRQSSRYAGGGTGTMGANRDHAGIFQEYIKDAAGKNIGMRIAEQYKGSGGVHSKDYMFGQGSGAKNGSNYNVVLGPDGQPLGGSRNPMNRAVTAKAPVVEAVKAQVSLPEMSAKGFGLGIQTPKPVSVPNPGKDIASAKPVVPDISAMSGEIARNSSWKSDAIKSWKPSDGNKATAPVADGVEAQNITGRLPGRNADAPGGVPAAGGGNGGNTTSSATTNNININGSNLNSEEIANAVQRKASEGMRRQSTGASPYSYI